MCFEEIFFLIHLKLKLKELLKLRLLSQKYKSLIENIISQRYQEKINLYLDDTIINKKKIFDDTFMYNKIKKKIDKLAKPLSDLISTNLSKSISSYYINKYYFYKTLKYGECDDCSKITILYFENCCGGCISSNYTCCFKLTCVNGCTFKCKHCGYIDKYKSVMGWHSDWKRDDKFVVCSKCKSEFEVYFEWNGNTPNQENQRYNCF